ncbi:hypothetical protein JL721_12911 [Aureococcus anophagefferens]|nr:hypothetical protein JL721_12911 [Aureococcus anophagefferens]
MSNELLRVRRVWERHDFALPCTEGDAEVVTVFEGFFLGRGRSLLAGQEQFADVTVEYGDFLSTMRLDVFDFEAMLFAQPAPSCRSSAAQLRSEQVGRFVAVRATVTRASAVRPLVVAASFSCAKCGAGEADDALRVKFPDGNFAADAASHFGDADLAIVKQIAGDDDVLGLLGRAKLELRANVTEDDARDVVALLRESVRDACTTPTGAVDFSRAVGGMSASRAVKALVAALHADADARRDPCFTMADVKDLARRAGVETSKPIADLARASAGGGGEAAARRR